MNTDDLERAGQGTAGVETHAAVTSMPTSPVAKRRSGRSAAIVGTILLAGGAILALVGPLAASAASPSPDPAASAATGTSGSTGVTGSSGTIGATGTTGTPGAADPGQANGPGCKGGPDGRGRLGGHTDPIDDLAVAAKAIGITEADLRTALQSGKTMADVANANNVDPQKVIDALVQDGLDELAADVTAGTITQAQADAAKTHVTEHATNMVNGTFRGGPGGPGGMGGHRGFGRHGGPTGTGSAGTGPVGTGPVAPSGSSGTSTSGG